MCKNTIRVDPGAVAHVTPNGLFAIEPGKQEGKPPLLLCKFAADLQPWLS